MQQTEQMKQINHQHRNDQTQNPERAIPMLQNRSRNLHQQPQHLLPPPALKTTAPTLPHPPPPETILTRHTSRPTLQSPTPSTRRL